MSIDLLNHKVSQGDYIAYFSCQRSTPRMHYGIITKIEENVHVRGIELDWREWKLNYHDGILSGGKFIKLAVSDVPIGAKLLLDNFMKEQCNERSY